MPKKKIDTEVETTEEIETTQEEVIVAPEISESEQIVEGNKELIQLRKDIAESRAEFVRQTDKQQAKIREFDSLITSKGNEVFDINTLINITLPQKQTELATVRNEAGKLMSQAETSLAEVIKREQALTKATAELSKQKEENDKRASDLELQANDIMAREKALKEAEKALDPIRKALGK